MIFGTQVLGVIFAVIMLYFIYYSFKRKELTLISSLFWLLSIVIVLIIIIFPQTINRIMEDLNINRAMDFFMIIAFMFFTIIVFYMFKVAQRTEKRVEQLTRSIALKPIKELKKER